MATDGTRMKHGFSAEWLPLRVQSVFHPWLFLRKQTTPQGCPAGLDFEGSGLGLWCCAGGGAHSVVRPDLRRDGSTEHEGNKECRDAGFEFVRRPAAGAPQQSHAQVEFHDAFAGVVVRVAGLDLGPRTEHRGVEEPLYLHGPGKITVID